MKFEKILDRMFKKVDGVVFDAMSNKVGIKHNDSVFFLNHSEDDSTSEQFEVVENPFSDLSTPLPAFAQATKMDAIKIGDLILNAKGIPHGWVIGTKNNSIRVRTIHGNTSNITPTTVNFFEQGQTVMVVTTMSENTNPMMMAMMMDDDSDIDPMMMAMMMSQGTNNETANAPNAINPMMLMMMLMDDDNQSSNSMMKLMMMQNMMGGQNSNMNPMMMAMMMAMMMDDDKSSNSMMKLMMMQNMMGENAQNPMTNPMMMLMLDKFKK